MTKEFSNLNRFVTTLTINFLTRDLEDLKSYIYTYDKTKDDNGF